MAKDLNAGMQCVKYMLSTTNFMFVMIGFLLICIGLVIKGIYSNFEVFMEARYFSPANLTVAIGAIIFAVALVGCIGALKESTCLINMYALCLSIILILELTAAIVAFTMRNTIKETVEVRMNSSMFDYENPDQYSRGAWDFLQSRMYCCGVHSFKEWTYTGFDFNKTNNACTNITIHSNTIPMVYKMPHSCCHTYFERGCLNELSDVLSESAVLLGIGALCVAFVQFMGVIFSRILANTVRSLKTQMLVQRQQRREELYKAIQITAEPKKQDLNDAPSDKKDESFA